MKLHTNKNKKEIILVFFLLLLTPQNNAYNDYNYDNYDYNNTTTNQKTYNYDYNYDYNNMVAQKTQNYDKNTNYQSTQTIEQTNKNTTKQNNITDINKTTIEYIDQNKTQTTKNQLDNKNYKDTNTTTNIDKNTSLKNTITQQKCTNENNCEKQQFDTNYSKEQTKDNNQQKTNQKENYYYKDENKGYSFTKIFIDNTPFIKIIDKNDTNYEPIEKEYYLFNQEKIKIRKEQDYNYIISNGAAAKTLAEITKYENKIIAKKSNKEYEINFSPIQAYKQNNITPTEPAILEIKENKATYLLKGKKSGKLLGLIWTEYEVKMLIDATTGKVLEETKPIWAHLVINT